MYLVYFSPSKHLYSYQKLNACVADIEEGQQTSMVLAMEWYIMNSTGVRSLTCNLGELVSPGTYILHDSCAGASCSCQPILVCRIRYYPL